MLRTAVDYVAVCSDEEVLIGNSNLDGWVASDKVELNCNEFQPAVVGDSIKPPKELPVKSNYFNNGPSSLN